MRILILIWIIGCTSCATIINRTYVATKVATYPANATIIVNNKDSFCCSTKEIILNKSTNPLQITLVKDSLKKEIFIHSKLSTAYILGNFFTPYFAGYFADLSNTKRFTYPTELYVNLLDSNNAYQTWIPNSQLPIMLTMGLPLVNNYIYKTGNETIDRAGVLGNSFGVEYYTTPTSYYSAEFGWTTNTQNNGRFLIYPTKEETRSLLFSSVRWNKVFGRFHAGIGLAYQDMRWKETKYDSTITGTTMRQSNSKNWAISTQLQWRVGRFLYMNVLYQPVIFNYKQFLPAYQHYFNVGIVYKFTITANRKLLK